jgi:hypothetical protein
MLPEAAFGLGAVEEHVADRRMIGEEAGQVVGYQRVIVDGGVEAPWRRQESSTSHTAIPATCSASTLAG